MMWIELFQVFVGSIFFLAGNKVDILLYTLKKLSVIGTGLIKDYKRALLKVELL
jgi:hypothetical protein